MPSMFTNSKELQINGGQFVVSSNKVEVHSQNGLDLLLKRSTLAARLDSKERNDPARCHPNTRAAVIREIMDWIRSEDPSPSMMWMRGPAGAGKTALAQSIGELCQKEEDLAASFFFSRTAVSSDQSDGGTLIPTIAYQLAFSYPEAKILIRRRIEKDPSVLELSNRTVMEKLLIEPFNSWLTVILCWITATFLFRWMGWFQPRLIVIDGLDECRGEETQCELLKVIGSTIQLLPRPFRILITSRPESHIQRTFGHEEIFRTINLKQLDLGVLNAEQDIRLFFSDKFEEIRKKHRLGPYLPLTWPPKEAVERLVQKASGQFIYASTVMKYLESPRHQPTSRLDIILGISPTPDQDTPFAQLDALYTFIFSSVDDFQTVRRIFGVLIVPRAEDDDLGDFTTPAMIEKLLCLNLGHVELVLDEFLSLVHLGAHDEPIKLHHASVADFLLNRSRSGDFYMDLGVVHEDLARGYMRLIRDEELNGRIQQPQSYVSPFFNHCNRALITDNLRNDLENFGFVPLYKRLDFGPSGLERVKRAWQSRLLQIFFRLLLTKVPNGKQIFDACVKTLDDYYAVEAPVKDSLAMLLMQPWFKTCACENRNPVVANHICDNSELAAAQHRALYLSILNPSTGDSSLNRALTITEHAVNILMQFNLRRRSLASTMELIDGVFLSHPQKLAKNNFTAALLNCGAIAISHSDYSRSLVQTLITYRDPESELDMMDYPLQFLRTEVIKYLQRVEPEVEASDLLKLKNKWKYESSESRWYYAGVAVSPNASG